MWAVMNVKWNTKALRVVKSIPTTQQEGQEHLYPT
jgi:hypothetical protein